MSDDLISRSRLIEEFDKKCMCDCGCCSPVETTKDGHHITYCHLIDEQPTAYDVEDKIKKLQQLEGNGHHDTLFNHKWELFLRANAVYRIVKDGGYDDEHTQEEFEFGNEPYCGDDGNNL